MIENYLYSERESLGDDVMELLEGEQPTILERRKTSNRILKRIIDFVNTFINAKTGS